MCVTMCCCAEVFLHNYLEWYVAMWRDTQKSIFQDEVKEKVAIRCVTAWRQESFLEDTVVKEVTIRMCENLLFFPSDIKA